MYMKNLVISGMLLVSGVFFAQDVKPKFVATDDNTVQATYYYDNGQVKQEGSYVDGKLDGKWVSYNEDGTKQASGEYKNGERVGTWTFWNSGSLSKVEFANSRIASVKKLNNDYLVTK